MRNFTAYREKSVQEGEIVSAVSRAFLHDQLILGFRETLHNKDYIAEEHIYPEADPDSLIAALRRLAEDSVAVDHELVKQREAALAETKESYYNEVSV